MNKLYTRTGNLSRPEESEQSECVKCALSVPDNVPENNFKRW